MNTVNTVGVMGKGIALVFKQLYPEMYKEYRRLCEEQLLSVGKLYIYRTPNKIIVNFPTKQHWRHPSRLDYLEFGLHKFVDRFQEYGISSIFFSPTWLWKWGTELAKASSTTDGKIP